MIYIVLGFLWGLCIPYLSRRFGKFMPASPAFALYSLFMPLKKVSAPQKNKVYLALRRALRYRAFMYGLFCAAVTFALLYVYGAEHLLWYLAFAWAALFLFEIDVRWFVLPDLITFPLLILGFGCAYFVGVPVTVEQAFFGAVVGFVLPVIASLPFAAKYPDALGGGDVKFLAVVGAWLGVEKMLYTIVLSCILFTIYAIIKRQREGAYGPAIALAALIMLLGRF